MSREPKLYRTPRNPGYLGGYNWRATIFGLLLLVLTLVFALWPIERG